MRSKWPTLLTLLCASAVAQAQRNHELLRGGDVSEIPEVEAQGGQYLENGKPQDPFVLLHHAGWNFVRFRIWNAPRNGFCDETQTLAVAKRAYAEGMKVSLDFHYSDWWADPGKQYKPAAWKDLSFDKLVEAVYGFTKLVVSDMIKQGTPPYMVQVGNEITSGVLWPDGRLDSNDPVRWHNLGRLVDAGVRAVHDAAGRHRIQTMIHLDRGGDNQGAVWWFDHILAEGVKFDAIGLSFYPFWHGSLAAMESNIQDLAKRYGKDVYIAETAYPWEWDTVRGPHVYNGPKLEPGFPATPKGQADFIRAEIDALRKLPNGHGRGILYWAPTLINTPKRHSAYENLAVFDASGNPLPAAAVLGGKG